MGSTPRQPRQPPRRARQARDGEAHLERLEQLLDLLLAAGLRGHLLPSERRVIKAYLEERRIARHERAERLREARGPECPACHGPLPSADLPRCPHCKLLLGVVRPRKA
ncbi:MAG TPA: hypothetical protein PK668_04455 [Myxococcota bacterium]|nr:hypothetical protein [Myxococcota bacterium]HRY92111.1 hypothetical protein [Myxococcota bacterium]HSA20942.1 hypothetical protein [Myxococcota bacterium]